MRYLLDQGLARSAVVHLRQAGIESVHVGDLGMAAASDAMILEEGLNRNAVVVTLDADFHRLLALSNATTPSVIRIRMEGLKGIDVHRCIRPLVIAQCHHYRAVRRCYIFGVDPFTGKATITKESGSN